jgi:hypothetical protein
MKLHKLIIIKNIILISAYMMLGRRREGRGKTKGIGVPQLIWY